MINDILSEAARPSDFWRDLLQMQLMMLRASLPSYIEGILQFIVRDGPSHNSFFINFSGLESELTIGEADKSEVVCLVESTEIQVSQVLFGGTQTLLDMQITGNNKLFLDYVAQAAKMKEALK